jgi:hypothetical protein
MTTIEFSSMADAHHLPDVELTGLERKLAAYRTARELAVLRIYPARSDAEALTVLDEAALRADVRAGRGGDGGGEADDGEGGGGEQGDEAQCA